MRARSIGALLAVSALMVAACNDAEEEASEPDPDSQVVEITEDVLQVEAGSAHIGTFDLGQQLAIEPTRLHGLVGAQVIEPIRVVVFRPTDIVLRVDLDSEAASLTAASVTLDDAAAGDVLILDSDAFTIEADGSVARADGTDTGLLAERFDANGDAGAVEEETVHLQFTGEAVREDYFDLFESLQLFNNRFNDPDADVDERLAVADSREIAFTVDGAGETFGATVTFDVNLPLDDPAEFDQSAATGPVFMAGTDGNDVLLGGIGDDVLFGGAGDNVIVSGGGDNVMIGGSGSNVMVSGEGEDRFVVTSLAGRPDIIKDFSVEVDDRLDATLLVEGLHLGLPDVAITPDTVDDYLRIEEIAFDDPELQEILAVHEDNGYAEFRPDSVYHRVVVDLDGPGDAFEFRTIAVLVDSDLAGRRVPDGVDGWIAV